MFRKLRRSKLLKRIMRRIRIRRPGILQESHPPTPSSPLLTPRLIAFPLGLPESEGRFGYGYSSMIGKRDVMEDFWDARVLQMDSLHVGLFAVFDGHGGADCAQFVQQNLFNNLLNLPMFLIDTKHALAEAYRQTDEEYLTSPEEKHKTDSGTTAITAAVIENRLFVANVGDSRAVLCKSGGALPLSNDHTPGNITERKRIQEAGGAITWDGARWRVLSYLAISRAFGDRPIKPFISVDPEIEEFSIDSTVEFLIIASDGLWDVISNQIAVNLVKRMRSRDPQEAARILTNGALERGSQDNITCMVVYFFQEGNNNSDIPSCSSQPNE